MNYGLQNVKKTESDLTGRCFGGKPLANQNVDM